MSFLTEFPAYLDLAIVSADHWDGTLRPFAEATRSGFSAKPGSTHQVLRRELDHLGATDRTLYVAISDDQFRRDGRPRADARITSHGVVLTFESNGQRYEYAADQFITQHENVRAIALTLEHLRAVDRYGLTGNRQQYAGFLAIESATPMPATAFRSVDDARQWLINIAGTEGVAEGARNIFILRRAKRISHPDQGGDPDAFQRVLDAEKYLEQNGAL
jgi:hypothetical protein